MTLTPSSDRLPNLERGVVLIGQDAVELNLIAGGHVAVIDVELLAFLDFHLASAVRDDRVHEKPAYTWGINLANQ